MFSIDALQNKYCLSEQRLANLKTSKKSVGYMQNKYQVHITLDE